MLSCSRRVLQELLGVRAFSVSAPKNTVVVERWWQVPLSKVGSPPRLHPRRHRIYKLVEDSKHSPTPKMELILTQTVPKLGGRGETVIVKKSVGRNKLLPEGLAVYPSPENKQMFAEELRLLREGKPEERIQTRTGQLTVDYLKSCKLKIIKMPPEDFQVNKEVICRAFLRIGVVVPPHALVFPFESVREEGEYWCEVSVNGIDTVRVPVSLEPYEDLSAIHQKRLKMQPRAGADASESDRLEAVAEEDSASQSSDVSGSAPGAAAANVQMSEEITAPSNEGPKKD